MFKATMVGKLRVHSW